MRKIEAALAAFFVFACLAGGYAFGASSEELGDPAAREQKCREELQDQFYIVRMYAHGVSFAQMRQKAINSRLEEAGPGGLEPERFQSIMRLIDEAEGAGSPEGIERWARAYLDRCMGEPA